MLMDDDDTLMIMMTMTTRTMMGDDDDDDDPAVLIMGLVHDDRHGDHDDAGDGEKADRTASMELTSAMRLPTWH